MKYRKTLYGAAVAAVMGLSCGENDNTTPIKINLKELKEAHVEGMKESCKADNARAKRWLRWAFEDAEEGGSWPSIQYEVTQVRNYAAECCTYNAVSSFSTSPFLKVVVEYANCSISPLEIDETKLKEVYLSGIRDHGRENLQKKIKLIFEDAREGKPWESIELSLKYAKEYAQEAGLKLEEVVDSDSLQQLYAQYNRK